jgi:hypothetical protein
MITVGQLLRRVAESACPLAESRKRRLSRERVSGSNKSNMVQLVPAMSENLFLVDIVRCRNHGEVLRIRSTAVNLPVGRCSKSIAM